MRENKDRQRIWKHFWSLLIPFVLLFSSGCGGATDADLAPPGGFNYAKVSYDPKPISDPTVIEVPEIDLGQYPNHLVEIVIPDPISTGDGLAFEGSIRMARPKHLGGILFLQFLQGEGDEKQATASAFLPPKIESGKLTYHIELHAPRKRGKHEVELKLFHPPTLEVPFFVAKGIVELE